ncbi:MAG: MBL fold metallo-hydrolase [Armatimonadetes bacterium]|nr:MBL fold metallo-hydrolase [Armatimonadota bacterium]
MSEAFWLVTSDDRRPILVDLGSQDKRAFRDDAIEITMYSVGKGEAIVISRGGRAILVDGGAGNKAKNDVLGGALAARLAPGSLRAIVASHPHRDHTNFYRVLAQRPDLFAQGAKYFDNGTQKAEDDWKRLRKSQANLPFVREAVGHQRARDGDNRIPLGPGVEVHLVRGKTRAKSRAVQAYWSVFLFLRYRDAWMLFTGDAMKGYEKLLLPRLEDISGRAHMLKVTHHGSSDGTSPDLVTSLRPRISIVSTAKDPTHRIEKDVRERLSDSEIYATYDLKRPPPRAEDIIVRTDGRLWGVNGFEGVLFEVSTQTPALT